MLLDNCVQCIYNMNCPCGYSLHNAACLTIASDNKNNTPEAQYYKLFTALKDYMKNDLKKGSD